LAFVFPAVEQPRQLMTWVKGHCTLGLTGRGGCPTVKSESAYGFTPRGGFSTGMSSFARAFVEAKGFNHEA
jgi:hypothetical protein